MAFRIKYCGMSDEERNRLIMYHGGSIVAVSNDPSRRPIGTTPDGRPFTSWELNGSACVTGAAPRYRIGMYQLDTLEWGEPYPEDAR